ncbi:MAG: DUF3467 domain-containing protein [Myxococcales bacterium]|nr:DUF3467 domain-containing protein [Myxococcales bacterium]
MNDPKQGNDSPSVVIKADDEIAKGRFANLAQVASSQDSFAMDFAFVQGKQGWLLSRILMSPQHAKRFSVALSETLAKYEARFGKIEFGPTLQ